MKEVKGRENDRAQQQQDRCLFGRHASLVVGRCGWQARSVRTITTLDGLCQPFSRSAVVTISAASATILRTAPPEEGSWALPHGEFGLDIIALIGALRYERHRSVPSMNHPDLFTFRPLNALFCAAQLSRRSVQRKSAGREMGACGWCMPLASASVEAVSCESSASGMGVPP